MAWCEKCKKTVPTENERIEVRNGRTFKVIVVNCDIHGKFEEVWEVIPNRDKVVDK